MENTWIHSCKSPSAEPMTIGAKLAEFPGLAEVPGILRGMHLAYLQTQAHQERAQARPLLAARSPHSNTASPCLWSSMPEQACSLSQHLLHLAGGPG